MRSPSSRVRGEPPCFGDLQPLARPDGHASRSRRQARHPSQGPAGWWRPSRHRRYSFGAGPVGVRPIGRWAPTCHGGRTGGGVPASGGLPPRRRNPAPLLCLGPVRRRPDPGGLRPPQRRRLGGPRRGDRSLGRPGRWRRRLDAASAGPAAPSGIPACRSHQAGRARDPEGAANALRASGRLLAAYGVGMAPATGRDDPVVLRPDPLRRPMRAPGRGCLWSVGRADPQAGSRPH